jgi:hypothetical protein
MRTVAIVSPHFPPSSLAGVHRARHLANHLPAHGWRPIILRADQATYTEPSDPALAGLVNPAVEQIRTGALPAGPMRRLGVGDIGLRTYPYLRRALDRLIDQDRPDVVMITGFPFYPMMLAGRLREKGLPVVLDFQDPWVSAYGASLKASTKAGLAHRLALALEPRAVRRASFVTSVSEVQNQDMAARYAFLDARKMAAIPIGGDPADFDALRFKPAANPQVRLDPARINLNYVGAFLPRAGPLALKLFQALARLRTRQPALANLIAVNFVGSTNQPGGGAPIVKPLAEAAGVADLVNETPERVPFLEALSLLANAQGLLLIGSDEAHYTASKIYPALMSGTPYLSLFHAASSSHDILSRSGGGFSFAFDGPGALDGLTDALADGLERLASDPAAAGRADPAGYADFTANAVAGRFAAIFDRLVDGSDR